MSRTIFDPSNIEPSIIESMKQNQGTIVAEVSDAIQKNKFVVVGMKGNPHCKNAVKALNEKGITHCYLEYGSYLSGWKERLNLKIWLGWKTFPMVFVSGQFIGGGTELVEFLAADEGKDV